MSPRGREPYPEGAARTALARTRVVPAAFARYEARARRLGVGSSVLLRRMLTYAERHMPDDFTEEDR